MSEDGSLSRTFVLADRVFREFAEMTAANDGVTFEEAYPAAVVRTRTSESGGRGRSSQRPGLHNPGQTACRRQAEPAIGRLLAGSIRCKRGRNGRLAQRGGHELTWQHRRQQRP
jgi:hypothetical protein